jgi:hypothetical protein
VEIFLIIVLLSGNKTKIQLHTFILFVKILEIIYLENPHQKLPFNFKIKNKKNIKNQAF